MIFLEASQRLLTLRLLEQMQQRPEYARSLGLTDRSAIHGRPVKNQQADPRR